jgi:hypothetical protein
LYRWRFHAGPLAYKIGTLGYPQHAVILANNSGELGTSSQTLVLRLALASKVGGVVVAPPDIASIGLDRRTDAVRQMHGKRSGADVGVS